MLGIRRALEGQRTESTICQSRGSVRPPSTYTGPVSEKTGAGEGASRGGKDGRLKGDECGPSTRLPESPIGSRSSQTTHERLSISVARPVVPAGNSPPTALSAESGWHENGGRWPDATPAVLPSDPTPLSDLRTSVRSSAGLTRGNIPVVRGAAAKGHCASAFSAAPSILETGLAGHHQKWDGAPQIKQMGARPEIANGHRNASFKLAAKLVEASGGRLDQFKLMSATHDRKVVAS